MKKLRNSCIVYEMKFKVFLCLCVVASLPQSFHTEVEMPLPIIICAKYDLSCSSYTVLKVSDVTMYGYTNDERETDSTPNITCSGRTVYEGSLAISQDLWGDIRFGDLVYVVRLKEFFVVEDTMNKRHKKSIDIFRFSKREALALSGKKTDIVVFRVLR